MPHQVAAARAVTGSAAFLLRLWLPVATPPGAADKIVATP